MTSPIDLSARELAARLARRELGAEAVTRAFLEHIAAVDAGIEAWEHLNPEQALAQARALDALPAPAGPLHGLPVAVKDLIDTADMPTRYGSPIHAGHQPATDAACVGQARAAGALVLGKTVTTEFAAMTAGKTRNPRAAPGDVRTPGGSSSGSAAAVAARMVPLALGTQTAASVVRPAAYCGVVGFKPTFALLPVTGVKIQSPSLDTVGAFARSVDDAAFFVGALARADLRPQRAPLLRVGLCRTPWWDQADADAQRVLMEAGRTLERRGAQVKDVALPAHWSGMAEAQRTVMAWEAVGAFAPERRGNAGQFSPAFAQMLASADAVDTPRVAAAHALIARARAELDGAMASCDVLIAPSATGVAPAGLAFTGDPVFGRLWSALGVPCVHVPCGQGEAGLPLGVTVIARPWCDALALGAAQWLEAGA